MSLYTAALAERTSADITVTSLQPRLRLVHSAFPTLSALVAHVASDPAVFPLCANDRIRLLCVHTVGGPVVDAEQQVADALPARRRRRGPGPGGRRVA